MANEKYSQSQLALLVACFVDLMRPSVGFSVTKLLEAAGCNVTVPDGSSCCGRLAYNSSA
jgi:L-lactate dehydrogenase complex protein LldE